jgi:oligopeptidase B
LQPKRGRPEEIVAARKDAVIEHVEAFKSFLVIFERKDGLVQQRVTTRANESMPILFPEPGYDVMPEQNRNFNADEIRYSYQSPITPLAVRALSWRSRTERTVWQQSVGGNYDSRRYLVERLEADNGMGVKIPVTLVSRRDEPKTARGFCFQDALQLQMPKLRKFKHLARE